MAETPEIEHIGRTLVVGAGVAGIRAALDLAEVGYRVLLTDASPAIGGLLSKLDNQFPSDHCGMCKMLPVVGREYASQYCMRKSLFHDNIKIMPFTEVAAIQGEPGNFEVELVQRARHVDTDVCIGTGLCDQACPIEVPDEFNQGLTARKAIFQPVPHNLPNMYVIDMEACDKCGKCVEVCPVNAINLEAQDERSTVTVDAIVFAAGTGLYDPATDHEMTHYTVSRNVVTSLEFERMLSGSGSYDGAIHRPLDGAPAKRIAWLQCMGSRNRKQGRDYCSSICCMFALKEAVLAHEKGGPDVETTIFYMDMRTFGKDFYRYREHAEEKHGVNLVRCRVHRLLPMPDGSVRVRYFDQKSGEFAEASFDLVVLSTGQTPGKDNAHLAELLDIELNQVGYFPSVGFDKVNTPREGVFTCGSFTGLTDIGESLSSGSAAASEASKLMESLHKHYKEDPELPPARDVTREEPSVAVILCRWNSGKMPDDVNMESVQEALAKRRGVGEVHVVETLCRGEGYDQAKEILEQTKCNRVLFGACLPYIYRKRLNLLAQTAGFNPALVEVVDLRSLIQRQLAEKDLSTLMRRVNQRAVVSIEKLKASDPLELHTIPIEQHALVVGGGVAGMRAALSLAERGVAVDLIERTDELGGRPLKRLHYTLEGSDPAALVTDMQQRVWEHKRITVYKQAEVVKSSGALGRFTTFIKNGEEEAIELHHGAAIVATGGQEAPTTEYCYDDSDQVVTQAELEEQLANGGTDPAELGTVVMIQCVGSREKGAREYCSRICCAAALKNAFKILERNPTARILVLYRDMMTYGKLEHFYTEARKAGVTFACYDLDSKPQVEIVDGKPVVRFEDPVLRQQIEVNPDLLALSTGIEPDASNAQLAEVLGVERTQDGFFQEAESKWRPVDFLKEGIFLAGTAHSPRPIDEVIVQAEAAAQRAYTYLSRHHVTIARVVSRIHDALCARCQACVEVCPYNARAFDPDASCIVVDTAACQGCGMCAVACPNSAAEVMGINEKQTMALIDATLLEPRHGVQK